MARILINGTEDFRKGKACEVFVKEGENTVSSGIFMLTGSSFADASLKTLLAGGLGTPPEYRRRGYIREMLGFMHKEAVKENAAVALLHTFSFSFYRRFGYEKAADHLIIRFPTEKIDFVPCEGCFRPCTEDDLRDMIIVYQKFAKGRGLLLEHKDYSDFIGEKKYICFIDGEPAAYVGFDTYARFEINRLTDTLLTVREFAFVSKEALMKLFSFLAMFKGEFETVEFANAAPAPEIDMVLRHYNHTDYRLVPDIEARPLNTRMILEANSYPREEGRFTVGIADDLPSVAGNYTVEFGGGDFRVTEKGREADIELSPGAFIRLAYGLDGATSSSAVYMDGVKIVNKNAAADFFRAFPKRPGGVFRHF